MVLITTEITTQMKKIQAVFHRLIKMRVRLMESQPVLTVQITTLMERSTFLLMLVVMRPVMLMKPTLPQNHSVIMAWMMMVMALLIFHQIRVVLVAVIVMKQIKHHLLNVQTALIMIVMVMLITQKMMAVFQPLTIASGGLVVIFTIRHDYVMNKK